MRASPEPSGWINKPAIFPHPRMPHGANYSPALLYLRLCMYVCSYIERGYEGFLHGSGDSCPGIALRRKYVRTLSVPKPGQQAKKGPHFLAFFALEHQGTRPKSKLPLPPTCLFTARAARGTAHVTFDRARISTKLNTPESASRKILDQG